MKKLNLLLSLVVLIFLASCTNNEVEIAEDLAFQTLEFRLTCGWCADGAKIIISNNESIEYTQFDSCDPNTPILQTQRNLTDDEKADLTAAFDLDVLMQIDLNECGVCYDGCEDLIVINGLQGETHSILYDDMSDYAPLSDIGQLITLLLDVRESF